MEMARPDKIQRRPVARHLLATIVIGFSAVVPRMLVIVAAMHVIVEAIARLFGNAGSYKCKETQQETPFDNTCHEYSSSHGRQMLAPIV
jgi:hypothetical protein